MKCMNCGMENQEGINFCIGCGNPLQNQSLSNMGVSNQVTPNNSVNMTNNNAQGVELNNQQIQINNMNVQNNNQMNNISSNQNDPLNFISYLINIIIKPSKNYEDNKEKLSNTKNAFILAIITSIIMTVITLVQTMISAARTYSYFSDSKWNFENLKELNYIKIIGSNFIIYIGSILLISVVFYLASLVIKKEIKFSKMLAISSSSMIPVAIFSLILPSLVAMIYAPLSIIVMIAGFIYGVIILYELINNELNLKNDEKIYFYFTCFMVLICISLFVSTKLVSSTSGLDIMEFLE